MKVIAKKRKSLNLSQEEVASRIGVTRQYYNAIENDRRKPSVELAKRLSKVLGVDWTIFFEEKVNN